MSYFCAQRRISKTRKPHRCEYCEQIIDKGEGTDKYFVKECSDVYSFYLCDTCNTLWREARLDWSEGITDFDEDIENWFWDMECPNCLEKRTWDYEFDYKTQMVVFKCDECGHEWKVNLFKYLEIGEWRAK